MLTHTTDTDLKDTLNPELTSEMAKHGITKKPIYYYYHGDYRYTSLRDALAQAKRTVVSA